MELTITAISPTAFLVVGAAYWAHLGHPLSPFYLAPFELEFYFHAVNDLDAERTIVRFGAMDELGAIKRIPVTAYQPRIVRDRPRINSEWAFAIELT
jgi:hypothetical protein